MTLVVKHEDRVVLVWLQIWFQLLTLQFVGPIQEPWEWTAMHFLHYTAQGNVCWQYTYCQMKASSLLAQTGVLGWSSLRKYVQRRFLLFTCKFDTLSYFHVAIRKILRSHEATKIKHRAQWCSGNATDFYLRGTRFKSLTRYRLHLRFSWFVSVFPGGCWDSSLKKTMTGSLQILSYPSLTIISPSHLTLQTLNLKPVGKQNNLALLQDLERLRQRIR